MIDYKYNVKLHSFFDELSSCVRGNLYFCGN